MSVFERWLLNLSCGVATITGLVYLYMKDVMQGDDPFSVLHHPWQPYVLALHVLSGPVIVFALGLIARDHILGRLIDGRPHRSRRGGIITVSLAVPMIASAYLLQVISEPTLRRGLVWTHLVSGVLFALLFVVHAASARPRLDWLARRGIESQRSPGGRVRWSRYEAGGER